MSDILSFLSEIGVYPILVLLWMKVDSTHKTHLSVLQYLTEHCPNCDALKLLLFRK